MPIDAPWGKHSPKSKEELHDLIELIGHHINSKIHKSSRFTKFVAQSASTINLSDYLKRFTQYLDLDETHLLYVMIYLERYLKWNKDSITALNIHRLIASIMCVGHKFWEDDYFAISDYARIAGITAAEMRVLEIEILFYLKFNLFITTKEYLESKEFFCLLARELEKTTSKKYALSLSSAEEIFLHPPSLKLPPIPLHNSPTMPPAAEQKAQETKAPATKPIKALPSVHLFHHDRTKKTPKEKAEISPTSIASCCA
ncbi:cyclin family putative virulence effector [Legionella sp. km772]|uniref:cyclin family putative virulence effector n=1 Tax=Legionella sp. km772 TaxID=2498111 RepID=UPI000F8E5E76|nr:cyclin family putative virulence effector [Legionella sp. km772]RUR05375.1 hypothetical protein ELY15_14395 [Legionella sp. km772]